MTRTSRWRATRPSGSRGRTGSERPKVAFPDGGTFAPVRIRVAAREVVEVRRGEERRRVPIDVAAEAELTVASFDVAAGGGYDGPLAHRQGKPMRPDVALAFDRMERAAREDGVSLLITSGYRSDAEQAVLFAANPDPKWVAPPGHVAAPQRHRARPRAAARRTAGWRATPPRFHFIQRYPHEPWHYGYTLNPRSTPRPDARRRRPRRAARYPPSCRRASRPLLARAAQRWNVSAALLAAQLYAESELQPVRASARRARRGSRSSCPARPTRWASTTRSTPAPAIDAQAHLMRDLLRRFGTVPLALAAYNAGPGAVAGCMCIPPYPETRGYVARILGLLGGAGEIVPGAGLSVRLVR